MSDELPSRIGMQPASSSTHVEPVIVARGPKVGAAIGGALATIGASLAAVPFPLPWLGPVLGAVLVGAGVVIAAINGVVIEPPKPPPAK